MPLRRVALALAITSGLWSGAMAQSNEAPGAAPDIGTQATPLRIASSRSSGRGAAQPAAVRPLTESEQANANTVSIISGGTTGTFLQFASDIMTVLDDGDKLRVLPVIGKGATQNVRDLVYLRGIDVGLIRTDSLEAIRREGKIAGIESQIAYIARLSNDEMHVVASKDITDLRQLAGKKVNIEVLGSGSNFSSRLVFERLGINAEFLELDQAAGLDRVKRGEISANIFWGGKPLAGVTRFVNDGRFHLLRVPYDDKLQDLYLPATLSKDDYPNFLQGEDRLETLAVSTILAVYNWPQSHERYKKLERFVDALFAKFDGFLKPPRHPKWAETNLAATVPGFTRFRAAQVALERESVSGASASQPKAEFDRFVQERSGAGGRVEAGERERLFRDFLDWQKTRAGR